MAVGVPEHEVFGAADAVLARGARVGGLLDQWWARLAERLHGETRLPTLPGEVSQAFVAVWQQAIQLAQSVVEQGLAEQRQVLETERECMAAAQDQARQDVAKARQQMVDAAVGRQTAELHLADLKLLLSQRQTQIDDLQQQRESLAHERREAQQHSQVLQQELQALRLKAEQERVAQETYVRGVEDRAHREVDHARHESKAMAVQLKDAVQQVEQSLRRLASIQTELSRTQQHAAAQNARAETLEQLIQVRQNSAAQRKPRTRKPAAPKSVG